MSRPLWRAVASSSRTLLAVPGALGHPTRATRYPRWINPKSPPADDDVRLDARRTRRRDLRRRPSPPRPLLSDNSNSDPPDSDNPDAPPPPTPRQHRHHRQTRPVVVRDPAVPYLGAFLLKDENNDADVIKGRVQDDVGVFAQITSTPRGPGNDTRLRRRAPRGLHRRRREPRHAPFNPDDQHIRALTSEIIARRGARGAGDKAAAGGLADFAAAVSTSSSSPSSASPAQDPDAPDAALSPTNDLQDVLQSLDKELLNAQLQSKLAREREYWLVEQMRGIKRELGLESDGKDKLLDKFRAAPRRCACRRACGRCVFDEELSKLAGLEPAASERASPGACTPPKPSPSRTRNGPRRRPLRPHPLKSRILEFLAVGKLRGSVHGKIILLVGPPGFFRFSVGGLTDVAEIKGHRRTYVVQALRAWDGEPVVLIDEVDKVGRGVQGDPASALLEMLDPEQNGAFLDHYMDVPIDLSRVLFVLTVSGYVSDEKLEIARRYLVPEAKRDAGLAPPRRRCRRGRKTEAGEAAWSRRRGSGAEGRERDAAATIREADVEIEKAALEVLIKRSLRRIYRKAALKIVQDLGEDVLPEPHRPWPRPPPPLPRHTHPRPRPRTSPVHRRPDNLDSPKTSEGAAAGEAATKPVTTAPRAPLQVPASVHVRITPENLKDYVGPPVYQRDRMYGGTSEGGAKGRMPPPGVSTGLGYLGNGPRKGGLQLTGKLGEVIRESAHISLSWVKSHAVELGITPSASSDVNGSSPAALDTRGGTFLDTRDIHVHMPEGSIGKEGPSAGTALVSAFVSLFTKTRINPDIAMTGEISLVGQVLPVGGLKEKILAAHRAGITTIVAPAANRADIEENEENVPASVREGIRFVLAEVFRGEKIVERWREQGLVGPEIPILESESLPAKEAVVAEL
ncbi:Lon protease C-terminal proteolytic domain-containing protein [Mycena olivaceomarginata]|nr:Lon protease C-terminal proteolytic domain-containing protein [Mycena olivaceomarginata]